MAYVDYNTKITKYLKMYKELSELINQEKNGKNSLIEKPVNIYGELQSANWNELGKNIIDTSSVPSLQSSLDTVDSSINNNLLEANEILYNIVYNYLEDLNGLHVKHTSLNYKISKTEDILNTKELNDEKNLVEAQMNIDIEKIEKFLQKINDLGTSIGETKTTTTTRAVTTTEPETQYGNKVKLYNALNGTWVVADTNGNLSSYLNSIKSGGIYQASDTSKYSDQCLSFAESYGHDLIYGTVTGVGGASSYAHASTFTNAMYDNKSDALEKIYSEIRNGNPVVLQVNGNSQGTVRHFVTVVGYNNNVKSASELTEDDLLIVDSWDGQLERMDTASSRFMTTGAQCHKKKYSGYYLRVKR